MGRIEIGWSPEQPRIGTIYTSIYTTEIPTRTLQPSLVANQTTFNQSTFYKAQVQYVFTPWHSGGDAHLSNSMSSSKRGSSTVSLLQQQSDAKPLGPTVIGQEAMWFNASPVSPRFLSDVQGLN